MKGDSMHSLLRRPITHLPRHLLPGVFVGLCLAAGPLPAEEPGWSSDLPARLVTLLDAAAAHPAYATASAHNPQFANKNLWPMLSGKEAFITQTWPKARLLVWAHPGQNGKAKDPLDPTKPENWLEDGKPATHLDLGPDVDLLLPASTTPYGVGFRGTPVREIARHVTVEAGATWSGGGDGPGRTITGNVWLKRGGRMYAQGATNFTGPGHVFVRNDNAVPRNPGDDRKVNRVNLSQYYKFTKQDKGSVEILGKVTSSDEFNINGCLVVLGPDSRLQPGRAASPVIQGGGTLALMDGAYFGNWINNFTTPDMRVTGTIQGGLPERPLTRPAAFGLAFKNNSQAQYEGPGARMEGKNFARFSRVPSLVLHPGSALRSYTANPATARLTFVYLPEGQGDKAACYLRSVPGSAGDLAELKGNPDIAKRNAWFDALPRGVDIWFAKGVTVDTVAFGVLRPGGLMLADPADRKAWKDPLFLPSCLAQGDALFSTVEKLKGNVY
jgi:hypothetical protein